MIRNISIETDDDIIRNDDDVNIPRTQINPGQLSFGKIS